MKFFERFMRSLRSQRVIRRVPPTRLLVERLEDRVVPSATGTRPITEVGNNVANPTLGTAGTDLLRVSPAAYADGISSPSLPNNPSARVISDLLNNQADPRAIPTQDIATIDQNSLSDFGYAWGQFIDHDMDLTPTDSGEFLSDPRRPQRPEPDGEPDLRALARYDPATGTSTSNPRAAGQRRHLVPRPVAGVRLDARRSPTPCARIVGGLLKTSPGNMLPYDNTHLFHAGPARPDQHGQRLRSRADRRTCSSPATCAATKTSS